MSTDNSSCNNPANTNELHISNIQMNHDVSSTENDNYIDMDYEKPNIITDLHISSIEMSHDTNTNTNDNDNDNRVDLDDSSFVNKDNLGHDNAKELHIITIGITPNISKINDKEINMSISGVIDENNLDLSNTNELQNSNTSTEFSHHKSTDNNNDIDGGLMDKDKFDFSDTNQLQMSTNNDNIDIIDNSVNNDNFDLGTFDTNDSNLPPGLQLPSKALPQIVSCDETFSKCEIDPLTNDTELQGLDFSANIAAFDTDSDFPFPESHSNDIDNLDTDNLFIEVTMQDKNEISNGYNSYSNSSGEQKSTDKSFTEIVKCDTETNKEKYIANEILSGNKRHSNGKSKSKIQNKGSGNAAKIHDRGTSSSSRSSSSKNMNEISFDMGTKVSIIRGEFAGHKADLVCHIKDDTKKKKKQISEYILAPIDKEGKDWEFCIAVSVNDFELIEDLKTGDKSSIFEHDLITHAPTYGNDSMDVSTYVSTSINDILSSECTSSSSDNIQSNKIENCDKNWNNTDNNVENTSNIGIEADKIQSNNSNDLSGKIEMNNVSIEKIRYDNYLSLREREMVLVGKKVRVTNEESKYCTRYGTIESVIDEDSYLISVAIVPSGGIYINIYIYIYIYI
jgi:hypothetical protein